MGPRPTDMNRKGSGCGDDGTEAADVWVTVEDAKSRCRALIDRIESLRLETYCSKSKANSSWKPTLLRLVHSELSFLSRLSSNKHRLSGTISSQPLLSFNVGHLEAIVYILRQPCITGVSRVCKPVPLSYAAELGKKTVSRRGAHVDVVCTLNGNPVWFIVSDRNPKYISWHGGRRNKSLKLRIEQILDAAHSSIACKPSSIILFFSNGLHGDLCKRIQDEFGATDLEIEFSMFDCDFIENLEDKWVKVRPISYDNKCILEIKLPCSENAASRMDHGIKGAVLDASRQHVLASHEFVDQSLGSSFFNLISRLKLYHADDNEAVHFQPGNFPCEISVINYDTTALIAIISGVSNGNTAKILASPECELRSRFKSNYSFVIDQVMSEIESPIHLELDDVISEKGAIICETVCSEFKELVSMCGGPSEKSRADHLLKRITVVPDSPSARMVSLPTTRKLAMKNKVVFGTGDHWHAPTLTANAAFVRAVSQTGLSLFTIEHRPRALIGD